MNDSEDLGPVDTQANKRSKTLTELGESSGLIPDDLIVDIFLRLPAKSIARYRCLSKLWASLLRLPYFTERFLIQSSSRPHLLFACAKNGYVFFFSSPQPQSLSILTTRYMKVPYIGYSFDVRFSSIKGLVFLRFEPVLRGHGDVSVICSPSNGQSLILPKVKARAKIGVRSYIGYDPVEKQYKVLSLTWVFNGSRWSVSEEHQVLTLGGKELSWRKIECSIPYFIDDKYHQICINGVLYYKAERHTRNFIIVCFDVRSEKFSYVKDTDVYTHLFQGSLLINYNGKLASLKHEEFMHGGCRNITLRVLEDAEKQVCSQQIYVLPDVWKNMVGDTFARFVGVTRTNEIVLSSSSLQCLFYFNMERNTIKRVEIQGMEAVKDSLMFTFQEHVEDMKLMEVF